MFVRFTSIQYFLLILVTCYISGLKIEPAPYMKINCLNNTREKTKLENLAKYFSHTQVLVTPRVSRHSDALPSPTCLMSRLIEKGRKSGRSGQPDFAC